MPHVYVPVDDLYGFVNEPAKHYWVPRPTQTSPHLVNQAPDFHFFVELGLLVRSRRRNHNEASGLEDEISARLTKFGIPNHIARTGTARSSIKPEEWTIASELCIPPNPQDHRFGIKLVSPVMCFMERPESWQRAFRVVMDLLDRYFELMKSHSCFTHVHIVPHNGAWSLYQVKNLAKTALYFEQCLDSIMPPYRRKSVWAKSNRHNSYFRSLRSYECFDAIDSLPTFEDLAAVMNWCSGDSATGRALYGENNTDGLHEDFPHDAYRWSFANLNHLGGGHGTVEFRQPPGSTTAKEVITWVMLVGCLARLSCTHGSTLNPNEKGQLPGLREWLLWEAKRCHLPRRNLLEDLLHQEVQMHVRHGCVGMDADFISSDEENRLRQKLDDRNIAGEKYRHWFSQQ
ncbi:uncharacterized protein CTHT_0055540 [Thermochaetoides thermophila DSM 1495]|uniref:Uncharacterized protein n=1 Tax=Chaetomium thermophilum (strain DSM 1495 / CBS 144.50 / IMI 039719) TaxID=759272 RepID=G0SC14_CHATD|nr:hypothetical protein CTHT_0055540 [Thermochaetoides thermophila DSM 1495]EGS18940.1 hypothetical protein CTHT_0055540 [Thermochaetoides thermophila DSM 1495]